VLPWQCGELLQPAAAAVASVWLPPGDLDAIPAKLKTYLSAASLSSPYGTDFQKATLLLNGGSKSEQGAREGERESCRGIARKDVGH